MDLKIYEKNEGVGGTWWENRYPGMFFSWFWFGREVVVVSNDFKELRSMIGWQVLL